MQALSRNPNIFEDMYMRLEKNNINPVQFVVDRTFFSQPCEVAEHFAKHFETIYNFHLRIIPSLFKITDLLILPTASNSDDCKAVNRL
jgi:hypothetical protein